MHFEASPDQTPQVNSSSHEYNCSHPYACAKAYHTSHSHLIRASATKDRFEALLDPGVSGFLTRIRYPPGLFPLPPVDAILLWRLGLELLSDIEFCCCNVWSRFLCCSCILSRLERSSEKCGFLYGLFSHSESVSFVILHYRSYGIAINDFGEGQVNYKNQSLGWLCHFTAFLAAQCCSVLSQIGGQLRKYLDAPHTLPRMTNSMASVKTALCGFER